MCLVVCLLHKTLVKYGGERGIRIYVNDFAKIAKYPQNHCHY
jgi:hypothetical protein